MSQAFIDSGLDADLVAFIEKARADAELAFQVFRDTRTITANGTVGFIERVPGRDILVSIGYPGPWKPEQKSSVSVSRFDGTLLYGKGKSGPGRYTKIFEQHPDVTTVSHVHSPALGAWAQTHRTLPIRYVPVQRFHLFQELPVYIDRRQGEQDFILDRLEENREHRAIIEANGGATVWGRLGLKENAEFILLLEEGTDIQIRAEAIGGSRNYGPGVLRQQWKMSQRFEQAAELGLLPPTDL